MNLTDEQREQRIRELGEDAAIMLAAGFLHAARVLADEMCAEIKRRSPEQIRRMEVERGLA